MIGALVSVCASASASFAAAFILSGVSGRRVRRKPDAKRPIVFPRSLAFLTAMRRRTDPSVYLEQMPEMIDIVVLGLSAGLSFDMALGSYLDRYDTELARELENARLSWRIGVRTRTEALESFASESGLKALADFASAVGESMELGAPLIRALERQAIQVRAERRSLIEERIEKVPVRMLIPLGTLILPAMLLAILGPLLSAASVLA